MRPYEDPDRHLGKHIERAAGRYIDGLNRAGLRPNKILTRAMSARAANEARADYEEQSFHTFQNNVHTIFDDYRQRDRQIRREGARMAWMMCPFAFLLLGSVSWLNFHQGDASIGLLCAVGALAFLVMLVLAHRQAR